MLTKINLKIFLSDLDDDKEISRKDLMKVIDRLTYDGTTKSRMLNAKEKSEIIEIVNKFSFYSNMKVNNTNFFFIFLDIERIWLGNNRKFGTFRIFLFDF